METGKGGMGSHKHGVSGTSGHSPRFRVNRSREVNEAQKADDLKRAKKKQLQKTAESVPELFGQPKAKRKKRRKKF